MACGIISDLAGALTSKMNEYLDDFVPCLLSILRNQEADRKLKLPAMDALCNLCLNSEEAFHEKFLLDTLTILNMAAQMSVTSINDFHDDPDTLEFLRELRDSLVEQYGTILVALGEGNLRYIS